jgi:hypothetical protein
MMIFGLKTNFLAVAYAPQAQHPQSVCIAHIFAEQAFALLARVAQ